MIKRNIAVQVRVLWGKNPIHVVELNPPRSFSIGEDGCDFTVPHQELGTDRLELVSVVHGAVRVAAPADADLCVRDARGQSVDVAGLEGSTGVELAEGHSACWSRRALNFEVSLAAPEGRIARAIVDEELASKAGYFGASLFSVGSLLAAAAFFVPDSGLTSGEQVDADQLVAMQSYLEAAAEREVERRADAENASQSDGSEPGAASEGPAGKMGATESVATNRKFQKQGPKDEPEPTLSRLEEARSFGIIGLLSSGSESDGPTAPWGRDDALGSDDFSFVGNMWGDDIGEAGGANGLSLFGASQGGGGEYIGIGIGKIRTIDGGNGNCRMGENCGIGVGVDRGGHQVKAPRLRPDGDLTLNGQLPREVIQRTVRQNFGRFRACYEKGLAKNPNLQGRVVVRFLIARDGTVSNAASAGSSLPDAGVSSCVVQSFYGLSFSKPEQGSVSVTYPLMLTPG